MQQDNIISQLSPSDRILMGGKCTHITDDAEVSKWIILIQLSLPGYVNYLTIGDQAPLIYYSCHCYDKTEFIITFWYIYIFTIFISLSPDVCACHLSSGYHDLDDIQIMSKKETHPFVCMIIIMKNYVTCYRIIKHWTDHIHADISYWFSHFVELCCWLKCWEIWGEK